MSSSKDVLPTVLIVEDDPFWQGLYRVNLLGQATILSAYTIWEAQDTFTEHQARIGIIILDACVPGDKPNTMPLVGYIRQAGFAGPMVAASSTEEGCAILMRAGCDINSGGKDLVPRIVKRVLATGETTTNVTRILVVDDDPAFVNLLSRILRSLSHASDVHWAKDGGEALDFLHRRKPHTNAPAPNLILMDRNIPQTSGLETLCAIKSDPALSVIPVIVLSTFAWPTDVLEIYRAQANGFILKPSNLDRFEDLARAIKAFWMDFTVLPSPDNAAHSSRADKGRSVAGLYLEAESQTNEPDATSGGVFCKEHGRRMHHFAATVRELRDLHEQQFQAIVEGDPDCNRFDLLIHMANAKKQEAKYACLRHVESHGCSNLNAVTNTSGT